MLISFDKFTTFLEDEKAKDFRPKLSDIALKYLSAHAHDPMSHRTSAQIFFETIWDTHKIVPRKRQINRANSTKEFTRAQGDSDWYQNIIYQWKNSVPSKRGDLKLASAAFYFLFRYEPEASYFTEIARTIWPQHSEEFKRFIYAKCGGDPYDSFEIISERFFATAEEIETEFPKYWVIEQPPRLFLPNEIFDDEAWLSAANFTSIPLVGRDAEIGVLNSFLDEEKLFSILPIVGPSGAGKTRLITEWLLKDNKASDWERGFIKNADVDYWQDWTPNTPTIIVIDYLFAFQEIIKIIVQRHNLFEVPVRLILVDRSIPNEINDFSKDYFFKALAEDKNEFDQHKVLFSDSRWLQLTSESNSPSGLKKIIASTLGTNDDGGSVAKAYEHLSKMSDAAKVPLFAALVADALKRDGKIIALDRRQLIEYYMSSRNRIPWKSIQDNDFSIYAGKRGEWASVLIVLATILNGFPIDDISDFMPDDFDKSNTNIDKLTRYCEWGLSRKSIDKMDKFEPSIFGETFFLLFLQEFRSDKKLLKKVNCILVRYSSDEQVLNRIAEFFWLLSQNLILDDDPKFERNSWKATMMVTSLNYFPSMEGSTNLRNSIRISLFSSIYFKDNEKSRQIINNFFDLGDLTPLDISNNLRRLIGSGIYFLIQSDIKKNPKEFLKICRRQKIISIFGKFKICLFLSILFLFIVLIIILFIPYSIILYFWKGDEKHSPSNTLRSVIDLIQRTFLRSKKASNRNKSSD